VDPLQTKLKLTFWPPPSRELFSSCTGTAGVVEIQPSDLPTSGLVLAYRVPSSDNPDSVIMPPGSLVKVPLACANERSLRITVSGPPGQQHTLTMRVLDEDECSAVPQQSILPVAPEEPSPPQRLLQWKLEGLTPLQAANGCGMADEVCIERYGSFLLSRTGFLL
jgi:hypothetical protein